jgi:hypothetical protein
MTLVCVEVTLCMRKLQCACRNHTRACQNHTHACGNHTLRKSVFLDSGPVPKNCQKCYFFKHISWFVPEKITFFSNKKHFWFQKKNIFSTITVLDLNLFFFRVFVLRIYTLGAEITLVSIEITLVSVEITLGRVLSKNVFKNQHANVLFSHVWMLNFLTRVRVGCGRVDLTRNLLLNMNLDRTEDMKFVPELKFRFRSNLISSVFSSYWDLYI